MDKKKNMLSIPFVVTSCISDFQIVPCHFSLTVIGSPFISSPSLPVFLFFHPSIPILSVGSMIACVSNNVVLLH